VFKQNQSISPKNALVEQLPLIERTIINRNDFSHPSVIQPLSKLPVVGPFIGISFLNIALIVGNRISITAYKSL